MNRKLTAGLAALVMLAIAGAFFLLRSGSGEDQSGTATAPSSGVSGSLAPLTPGDATATISTLTPGTGEVTDYSDFRQLAAASDVVVLGTVTGGKAAYAGEFEYSARTVTVTTALKGSPGKTITVAEFGEDLKQGSTYALFLQEYAPGGTAIPDTYMATGITTGAYLKTGDSYRRVQAGTDSLSVTATEAQIRESVK